MSFQIISSDNVTDKQKLIAEFHEHWFKHKQYIAKYFSTSFTFLIVIFYASKHSKFDLTDAGAM